MTMHRTIRLTAAAILFCCAFPSLGWGIQVEIKDRVAGRWEANGEKTKEFLKEHADARQLPAEFLDNLPKIVFEFTAAGETNMSMEGPDGDTQALKGKWNVGEEKDADHATLHIVMMVDEKEDAKDVTVEFVDGDTMAFSIEDQPTLVFVRAEQKAAASDEKASDK